MGELTEMKNSFDMTTQSINNKQDYIAKKHDRQIKDISDRLMNLEKGISGMSNEMRGFMEYMMNNNDPSKR